MTFSSRKNYGIAAERQFDSIYKDWWNTSAYQDSDFTSTEPTQPFPPYSYDRASGNAVCEIKNSCFWNQAEYLWQSGCANTEQLTWYLYTPQLGLVLVSNLKLIGPFPGSAKGSGLPYYKIGTILQKERL